MTFFWSQADIFSKITACKKKMSASVWGIFKPKEWYTGKYKNLCVVKIRKDKEGLCAIFGGNCWRALQITGAFVTLSRF